MGPARAPRHNGCMHLPLTDDAIARLEHSTRDAVAPPAHDDTLDGWLLSFDSSTVGRAKSAAPLRHHSLHPAALPDICARYTERGLKPVFRLADVAGLANVQEELRRLGFAPTQATLVQVAPTSAVAALADPAAATWSATPTAQWAAVYTAPGFDPVDGQHRVQALSRGQHGVYATVVQQGQPVCAGTAVYSQGWASLHGLRTEVSARGQGLARQLMACLAQEALQRGLTETFLQVEAENTAALALYRRAGFVTAWRYHYWRTATD
jgi:ribosomal protein S18 acetylase RimI-like enzyme